MNEIFQDCLSLHERHLKANYQKGGVWDFSIKIMNKMYEYAIFEFKDEIELEKVDIKVYYRFSSLCMILII